MKIFYTLPDVKSKADMLVINSVRTGQLLFLLISALTVFLGLREWLSPYLTSIPFVLALGAMILGFALACLGPDTINSRFFRYGVKLVLEGKLKDALSIILLLVTLAICAGLTFYSFRLSRMATEAGAWRLAGEANTKDITLIDSTFQASTKDIDLRRDKELERIATKYQNATQIAIDPLKENIKRYEEEIKALERNRTTDNTQWTDKRISAKRRGITSLKGKVAKIAQKQQKLQLEEESQIEDRLLKRNDLLASSYTAQRDSTEMSNAIQRSRHQKLAGIFVGTLKGLAGWSVILMLIFAGVLQILYHRNGIEPDPVFTPFDFQPSALKEVLAFPAAFIGRHTLNRVREAYNALPALVERTDLKELKEAEQRQTIIREHPATAAKEQPKPSERVIVAGFNKGKESVSGPETKAVSSLKLDAETKGPETAETFETTKIDAHAPSAVSVPETKLDSKPETITVSVETLPGLISQLKEKKRRVQSYEWKIKKGVGSKTTNEKNIEKFKGEISSLITKYHQTLNGNQDKEASLKAALSKVSLEHLMPS